MTNNTRETKMNAQEQIRRHVRDNIDALKRKDKAAGEAAVKFAEEVAGPENAGGILNFEMFNAFWEFGTNWHWLRWMKSLKYMYDKRKQNDEPPKRD